MISVFHRAAEPLAHAAKVLLCTQLLHSADRPDADSSEGGVFTILEEAPIARELVALPATVKSLTNTAVPLETILGSSSASAVGHTGILAHATRKPTISDACDIAFSHGYFDHGSGTSINQP